MDKCMKREAQFEKILVWVRAVYVAVGVGVMIWAAINARAFEFWMALGTLGLLPLLWGVYRLFHWQRGAQLECWIYAFAFLSYTLGGVLGFYTLVPHFDKLAHTLSGVFVALLAFALYLYLERKRPIEQQNAATAVLFVFFASMAVAGLFEIGEFAVAPLVGRDLQHVQGTGVGDTMTDMIVCLIGTAAALPFVARFYQGRYDPLTGGVDAFLRKNHLCGRG